MECKNKFQEILRSASFTLLMIILPCVYAHAQSTVTGNVTDGSGMGVIGASVIVKGTTTGTTTDDAGFYSLRVPSGDSILEFACIGYKTQEVPLNSRSSIMVTLQADISMLEETVVVGYGVQKKKLITGATVQVKGEDIGRLNTVNVLGALQSQTPGVNIIQSSGEPGQGFKVSIRGLGTIGDSEPLVIIDGIAGGDLNALNPNDIESVDVLKDAASAAIYGSRAANGVILVTTKQGHAGETKVSLDYYYGIQNVYREPQLLNAQEYAAIENEGRLMDGLAPYDFAEDVPNWDKIESGEWTGTNWFKLAENKNAPVMNGSVNITGGNENAVYSLGFGYTSQEGIIGQPTVPYYDRYSLRMNSEYTVLKIGNRDIVKIGENFTYAYSTSNGMQIGDMWSNDIRDLLDTSPFLQNKEDDGSWHYAIPWEIRQANPLAMEEARTQSLNKEHEMKAGAYMTVEPIIGLIFKSSFGYTLDGGSWRSFSPIYQYSSTQLNTLESVSQSEWLGTGLTWENTLSYNFSICDKHHLNMLVGQSIEKSGMGESVSASNGNPIFHDFKHAYVSNALLTTINSATSMGGMPWGDHKLASFFGRLNYDYDNTYLFTAVLRGDGSSNFPKGKRWGVFPSVSAGWVITNEDFMEHLKDVADFLKIRASWGQNGNQSITAFQYLAPIATDAYYTFGNDKTVPSIGSYPSLLPNEDITWETSEQFDAGIDARFLKNRLSVALDYYIKNTKNWLVDAPQLASYGTGAPYINGGDIRNNGFEIDLGWDDNVGELHYGINLNLSCNKNRVTRLANSEGIIHGDSDVLFTHAADCYRAQVGYPVGYFYGYKTLGIFQTQEQIDGYDGAKLDGTQPGDVIWQDTDGDGQITADDRTIIGDPNPDSIAGFGIDAQYKGFDVSATMNGVFGNQIYRSYRSWSDMAKENYTADIFERWHGEGTSNRYPRLTSGVHTNRLWVSDLYVEDGDYVRMQNFTFGYDFNTLFKSNVISKARLYFAVENLFTITKYEGLDPEVGYGHDNDWVSGIDVGFYPRPRTYMLGVSLAF
jgi:TonB-linked outer membrane protein, SusC/RagA family